MTGPSPRDHALKVAVLEALLETVKSEYAKARAGAQEAFRTVRTEGGKQQAVMLPDGTEIGLISIKAGTPSVAVDEDALTAWVQEHVPEDIEEYVVPEAWSNRDVIEMVRACFPGVVRERIRPATREALIKEMADCGGKVTDKGSGEVAELGEVEQHEPTGAFALTGTGAKGRRDKIMAAWRAGELREIALGPLTLPEGEAQ